jgi:hypothetical protein
MVAANDSSSYLSQIKSRMIDELERMQYAAEQLGRLFCLKYTHATRFQNNLRFSLNIFILLCYLLEVIFVLHFTRYNSLN